MRPFLAMTSVIVFLALLCPTSLADDATAVRDQIDVALDQGDAGTLERRADDMPLDGQVWAIGGGRQADGTCCPPPPPPKLREDPCTPIDRTAAIDCCASPFSVKFALAFAMEQGNSDKYDLSFTGDAKYDRAAWIVRLRWLAAIGEENGLVSTDRQNAVFRVERRLNTKWSAFGQVGYDRDDFADLQYRWIGLLGGAYKFFEYKGTFLKGEAGLGATLEKRRGLPETEDPAGYLGLEYERKFRNGVDLSTIARFLPNLGEFDLSVFVLEAVLAMPLTESISGVLNLRLDHVVNAPAPTKDTDLIFLAGVQLSL
jgi:hypothetical protein